MSASSIVKHSHQIMHHAWLIAARSFRILKSHPQVLIYPYLAVIFIFLTSPIVGRFVLGWWQRVQQPELIGQLSDAAPNELLIRLGLVSFVVFYTFFVTSYFTCMISASTLAQLEDRPTSLFYGLKIVMKRFLRVSKFAILAIFFMPIGIIAQYKKLTSPRGVFEAITSSFSLNMSQLAPAIVTGNKGVFETVRHSINTLGHLWKESLVIRIVTFISILLLTSISFLPKLIEHYWFDGRTAHIIGWIATTLLWASSYVVLRVISSVMTTTLYHEAKNKI